MSRRLRLVLTVIVAVLLVLTRPVSAAAVPMALPDVHGTAYEQPVTALYVLNVARGNDQGQFVPAASVKRVEAAAMVIRSVGLDSQAEGLKGATQFKDVNSSYWGSGYVNLAARERILKGFEDGTARPEATVTYAEMVTMLIRALGLEARVSGGWPDGYLALAKEVGLTDGVSLSPGSVVSRGDVARLCYNAIFKVRRADGTTLAKAVFGVDDADVARVDFIDVGQGDAILVETPDGHTLLVDGGPEGQGATVLGYLRDLGISRLDAVVATHPHADHIGGLDEVLEAVPTSIVYDVGYPATSQTYADFLAAAGRAQRVVARAGGDIPLGEETKCDILYPYALADDPNNSSAVLKVSFGDFDFLLMGDVEASGESELLAKEGTGLSAEVLKVGHHGSSTSSTKSFLAAVHPDVAVIEVGAGNTYGHPAQSTLEALRAVGASVYRTDANGSVAVLVLGNAYKVVYEKATVVGAGSGGVNGSAGSGAPSPTPPAGPRVFCGSAKSNKYHWPSCRYAQSISPENLIWFSSAAEAQRQGYSPCSVCNPPR